jgi:hypothetical protein
MLAEGGMGFTIVRDHNVASPYLWVAADLRLRNVSARAQFVGARSTHYGSKGNLMVYQIVVQRNDGEIDTLYWSGSLEETINLAREIGIKCEADRFRVIELAGGIEAYSERSPFSGSSIVAPAGQPLGFAV